MSCAICRTRRPRRSCPGVHGDICAICCGKEREVTVDCPFDCEYLREARKHEPPAQIDPATMGNPDIRVTEEFLESNGMLMLIVSHIMLEAAGLRSAVDSDVRDALAGLIETYRTLQRGVIYESLPANLLAASVFRAVQEAVYAYLQEEKVRLGRTKTRDMDVLRLLVFFERLALDSNNGRPRCRAFLDVLRTFERESKPAANAAPSLILP
jgi:hypothetical protein